MKCPEYGKLLDLLLDSGEGDIDAKATQLDKHVEQCSVCKAEFKEIQRRLLDIAQSERVRSAGDVELRFGVPVIEPGRTLISRLARRWPVLVVAFVAVCCITIFVRYNIHQWRRTSGDDQIAMRGSDGGFRGVGQLGMRDVRFLYEREGEGGRSEPNKVELPSDDKSDDKVSLRSKIDHYGISFLLDRDSWIYVVQIGPGDDPSLIFPNKQVDARTNPLVRSETRYYIPEGGAKLYLDNRTGIETLYIAATNTRWSDLESLFEEHKGESMEARGKRGRTIANLLETVPDRSVIRYHFKHL